jgi:hypothetical protein
VNVTLVVVFNELKHDITLEIEAQQGASLTQDVQGLEILSPERGWLSIQAGKAQAIEIPPGTYDFEVTYSVKYEEMAQTAAKGTKTWDLNKAYRLHITERR